MIHVDRMAADRSSIPIAPGVCGSNLVEDSAIGADTEGRIDSLMARLLTFLSGQDAPDAVGSTALILATLVAEQEIGFAKHLANQPSSNARHVITAFSTVDAETLLQQVRHDVDDALNGLPAYVEEQRARGSREDLGDLVAHFIRGDRATWIDDPLPSPVHSITPNSAPLLPQQNRRRLRELAASGVDLSLLRLQMDLTPTERVMQMRKVSALFDELWRAGAHERQLRESGRNLTQSSVGELKADATTVLALGEKASEGDRVKEPDFDPAQLLQALVAGQVEMVLVGGLAMVGRGINHATGDIDICYNTTPENRERLVAALLPLHPRPYDEKLSDYEAQMLPFRWDARTLRTPINLRLRTDAGRIDILVRVEGLGDYPDVRSAATTLEIYDQPVAVLHLEGLLASKRAAGRAKDLRDLPEIEAMIRLEAQQAE